MDPEQPLRDGPYPEPVRPVLAQGHAHGGHLPGGGKRRGGDPHLRERVPRVAGPGESRLHPLRSRRPGDPQDPGAKRVPALRPDHQRAVRSEDQPDSDRSKLRRQPLALGGFGFGGHGHPRRSRGSSAGPVRDRGRGVVIGAPQVPGAVPEGLGAAVSVLSRRRTDRPRRQRPARPRVDAGRGRAGPGADHRAVLRRGGATSLRGYKLDRAGPLDPSGYPVGGNMLIVGNIEVRFPDHGKPAGAPCSRITVGSTARSVPSASRTWGTTSAPGSGGTPRWDRSDSTTESGWATSVTRRGGSGISRSATRSSDHPRPKSVTRSGPDPGDLPGSGPAARAQPPSNFGDAVPDCPRAQTRPDCRARE